MPYLLVFGDAKYLYDGSCAKFIVRHCVIPQIENWKTGQTGRGVAKVGYEARQTTPPKPYTEATLLGDMKAAAKFLTDPRLREALKEAEGIGTPATRAATIEKLKDMGYLVAVKATIRSTDSSRAVVHGLPGVLVDPGTTAMWEEMLAKISRGEMPMEKFMALIEGQVGKLVEESSSSSIKLQGKGGGSSSSPAVPVDHPCPNCGGKLSMVERWVKCEKGDFTLFREIATVKLSDAQLNSLIRVGRIGPLDGFFSQAKKKRFSATLVLEKDGKTKFDFSR